MVNDRIAIIPARGDSKRIPRKNIVDFDGKPMIAWTILAAKNCDLFDHVLVSTDDEEIAEVSKACGADVPFLRKHFADDVSSVSQATVAALNQAENYWKKEFRTVVQLMANCPLRNSKDIVTAVNTFDSKSRDFQISCFQYGWMNPWWAAKLDSNNRPERIFPNTSDVRSQDLPHLYCPTGAIWIASSPALKSANTFYGHDHRFEPIPWTQAVDIDDYDDLQFALAIKTLKANRSR